MADERDRFGDKIHDVEKAREDQWARDEDRRLLEKMRQKHTVELHCPHCNSVLSARAEHGVTLLRCPAGHGAWLEPEALAHLGKATK
jgi:hypothetical protein